MKRFLFLLVGVGALMASGHAVAEEHDVAPAPEAGAMAAPDCCEPSCCDFFSGNFYLSVEGGLNIVDTDRKNDVKFDEKVGYSVGGSIGYRFCNGLSLEEEFLYRYNKFCCVDFCGWELCCNPHYEAYSFYTNLIYKFPCTFTCANVGFYIGGGVGYTHQDVKRSPYKYGSGDQDGFGWQVLAGFDIPLYECLELGVDYRFQKGQMDCVREHSVNFSFTYIF